MQLHEIFGMGKKKEADPDAGLSADEKEELRRQRVNTLRTSDKPAAGKIVDKKVDADPFTMSPEDFNAWHGQALQDQGNYSSVGPQAGDLIMSHKGPLTVVDPNGGGDMVATVKQGDKGTKVSWNKLSKPVKKGNKQFYVYG